MNIRILVVFYSLLTIFDRTQINATSRLVFKPPIKIDNEHNSKKLKNTHKANMEFIPPQSQKSDHFKAPFEFLQSLILPYISAHSKTFPVEKNNSRPFYPMNVNFNFNKNENNFKANTSVETEWEFEFELGSYSSGNHGSFKNEEQRLDS